MTKILCENYQKIPIICEQLQPFGNLVIEEVDDLSLLWDTIRTAVEKFVNQVNDRAHALNLSQNQKNLLFTQIINQIMQHGQVSLDIPGVGKVSQIGTGARTFSKEKPKHVQADYKERIRKRFQELMQSGQSEVEAKKIIQGEWHGLDKKILANILRGQATKGSLTDESKIEQEFNNLTQNVTDGEELSQIALLLCKKYKPSYRFNVSLMIWNFLNEKAIELNISLPAKAATYQKFIRNYR